MDSMEKLVDRKGWRVIRENNLGLVSFLSGTTKRVATAIADAAGADLYEITPTDWDSYDTVLIGYPIWWGIAAWPVDNFVKGNDFTGKTVIPFCTSASSGLGDSGSLLEEMVATGDWQEGHRFSSGASDADAADWVVSLDLNE